MHFEIIHSRRVNKILFLVFLVFAVGCFAGALIFAFRDNDALTATLLLLALICLGFALLYGILWFVFALREKKKNQMLNAKRAEWSGEGDRPEFDTVFQTSSDTAFYSSFTSVSYTLPKEELLDLAARRLRDIEKWLAVGAIAAFGFIYIPVTIEMGFGGMDRLFSTIAFSIIIVLPGLAIQWSIYAGYAANLPERIGLAPGWLAIDELFLRPSEIKAIVISSPKVHNPSASKVFRTLSITTDRGTEVYNIDYRSTSAKGHRQPRWNRYEEFCSELVNWGKNNGVSVKLDYMD